MAHEIVDAAIYWLLLDPWQTYQPSLGLPRSNHCRRRLVSFMCMEGVLKGQQFASEMAGALCGEQLSLSRYLTEQD